MYRQKGNKTEPVALAMRRLLEQDARVGSLFGVHRGSVRVRGCIDLVAPALDAEPDAETGREIDRRRIDFCSTRISCCGSTAVTDRLGTSTRASIDGCWQNSGTIFLSAVSAWEIALLVDTGRIELDVPVETWSNRFLDRPGLKAAPLSHNAASRAYQLHHLEHRDPADRLLIATGHRACLSAGHL